MVPGRAFMPALFALRWSGQRTSAGSLVPAREVMDTPLSLAVLAHFREGYSTRSNKRARVGRRSLGGPDVGWKSVLALDTLGVQGHLLRMALRAFNLLFLSTCLAINVEERRLAAADADDAQGLATGGALYEVLPHFRLAREASDVDRGLLPAEWADYVLRGD